MKKVLIIISALAVALVVSVNINLNMQKSSLTGLALMNLEALAGESGSGESGSITKTRNCWSKIYPDSSTGVSYEHCKPDADKCTGIPEMGYLGEQSIGRTCTYTK